MEDLVVLGVGRIALAKANEILFPPPAGCSCCETAYLVISCLKTFVPLASLCVHVQSRHDVHVHQLQRKKESVNPAQTESSTEAWGVPTESTLP